MSSLSPFLLVGTLVAAVAVASMTQAQPAAHAVAQPAAVAQLHTVSAPASSVGPAALVLAAR